MTDIKCVPVPSSVSLECHVESMHESHLPEGKKRQLGRILHTIVNEAQFIMEINH